MAAVALQRPCHALPELRIERSKLLEGGDRPYPVDGADRDLHRIRPVDAATGGVSGEPRVQLALQLDGVPVVLPDPGGTRERQQLVTAAQLPRHLGVTVVREPRHLEVEVEGLRPAVPALEVAPPVDLLPQP